MDEAFIQATCKPGRGAESCRYLCASDGWRCAKFTEGLRSLIESRVAAGTLKAQGDNCPGREWDDCYRGPLHMEKFLSPMTTITPQKLLEVQRECREAIVTQREMPQDARNALEELAHQIDRILEHAARKEIKTTPSPE